MKKIIRVTKWNKLPEALNKAPIVIVENGQGKKEEIIALTEFLGGNIDNKIFNPVRTLKVENTINKSVGSSNDPHPPHTDGCYKPNPSSHIILQCVEPDRRNGGLGLFWTLDNYFENMSDEHYEILKKVPVVFSRLREDGVTIDEYEGTILEEDDSTFAKAGIRWRYDQRLRPEVRGNISAKDAALFQEALVYTINYFHTEQPIIVPYKKGDILIASNRYLTHGRTRILDNERVLHRAWLQLAS